MNQGKTNKRTWFSLGLAVFLCIAALVLSVGTAQARYRAEREETISYAVREGERIEIGTVREVSQEEAEADSNLKEGDLVCDIAVVPKWVTIEDARQLTLSVANGSSGTDFSNRNQKIRLRMLGTAAFWTGEACPKVYLQLPAEDTETGYTTIQAQVKQIAKDTVLYSTHGDGWILNFYEKENEEVSWLLEGGQLNYVTITVVMENVALDDYSLLQPQIIAEVLSE